MADVRALLKAKRTERGTITKPLKASIGRSTRVHPHTLAQPKRKLDNESEEVAVFPNTTRDEKRRKVEEPASIPKPPRPVPSSSSSGFPSDFFSDPSKAPQLGGDSDDASIPPTAQGPSTSSQITVDAEFEAFERAIAAASKSASRPPDQAVFTHATVFADPELIEEVPEGFPESVVDRDSRSRPQPVPIPPPFGSGSTAGPEPDTTMTEIEKQKGREQDERELIMDRLVDEERAQEDADARVNALKARMEAIKKKREAVRAEKAKQKQAG